MIRPKIAGLKIARSFGSAIQKFIRPVSAEKSHSRHINTRSTSEDCSGTTMDNLLLNSDPRTLIQHIMPGLEIPDHLTNEDLFRIIAEMFSEPDKRQKLPHFNTFDDVLTLLKISRKIIVVTGAGVSVSCGIPDFRSKNGIYARLHCDFPDLPDPQAMFDIEYFRKNPRPFFDFAREIYPGHFKPSFCHLFIKHLEANNQLLRNYTQNIDTLEQEAKIQRVIHCHGSFATASCCVCKYKVNSDYVKEDIMAKRIPLCPNCPNKGEFSILKPDITFFGEALSNEFHDTLQGDKSMADLLIVIGSSMNVRPVSLIPHLVPDTVPQILINRERLTHMNFDVELLGDCDDIVHELCRRLGAPWDTLCTGAFAPLNQVLTLPPKTQILDELPKVEAAEKTIEATTPGGSNDTPKSDVELLRDMYKPRMRKISTCLQKDTFLFMPPNRYVFKGAELYEELSDESSDDFSVSSNQPMEGSNCTATSVELLNENPQSIAKLCQDGVNTSDQQN